MANRAACLIDLDNAQIAAERSDLIHCGASRLWTAALLAFAQKHLNVVVDVRRVYGNTLFECSRVFRESVWRPDVIRQRIGFDIEY